MVRRRPEFAALAPADRVPTIDDEFPDASYPDWLEEDTRVVTCAIGDSLFPGERFESRAEAKKAITARHGRIYEANYLPGRAFFRVKKVK